MKNDAQEKPVAINKPARREYRVGRPNHRTTILTVDKKTYRRVSEMGDNEEIQVEFVNDIISSAKGGSDNQHHSIRRFDLIERQLKGGYRKIKVRCRQGEEQVRFVVGSVEGDSDSCSARVWVAK